MQYPPPVARMMMITPTATTAPTDAASALHLQVSFLSSETGQSRPLWADGTVISLVRVLSPSPENTFDNPLQTQLDQSLQTCSQSTGHGTFLLQGSVLFSGHANPSRTASLRICGLRVLNPFPVQVAEQADQSLHSNLQSRGYVSLLLQVNRHPERLTLLLVWKRTKTLLVLLLIGSGLVAPEWFSRIVPSSSRIVRWSQHCSVSKLVKLMTILPLLTLITSGVFKLLG